MFTFDDISLKKILVPVDGSNQSKEALRRAAHLAQQFDATLTLISVVELGKVMSGVFNSRCRRDVEKNGGVNSSSH